MAGGFGAGAHHVLPHSGPVARNPLLCTGVHWGSLIDPPGVLV